MTIESYSDSWSGFEKGVKVTVGGQPCQAVVILSQSTLSCITPPGEAGYADVEVSNPSGSSSLRGYSFSYLPLLRITSIHPK